MQPRALAIVGNGNQMLFAIQIKHTLFQGIPMDLIYVEMDIDEEAARCIFDDVFFCRSNSEPPKNKATRCFFDPEWAMTEYYTTIDLSKYTDVFFYHPNWVYYFLYKYSLYRKHEYVWHLLPEGAGAYIIEYPEIRIKKYGSCFSRRIITMLDKNIFGYSKKNMDYIEDVYLINPRFSVVQGSLSKVAIPAFDMEDPSYIMQIKSILKYKPIKIENKIIILDGSCDRLRRTFYDVEEMDKLICLFGERVGKENILVKRKNGVGMDQYSDRVKERVSFYEDEHMPWELICMNGDIHKCVIVSVISSAIVLPFIFCGFEMPTFRISEKYLRYRIADKYIEEDNAFFNEVMKESSTFHDISSEEDVDYAVTLYESMIDTSHS